MTTLKELAQQYVPPSMTENISEAGQFDISTVKVEPETHQTKEGKEFTVQVAQINGKKYRVPASVLGDIKSIMQVRPDIKSVTVLKSGTGMNTKYQVIPA